MKILVGALSIATMACLVAPSRLEAAPLTLTPDCITNNSATNCADGEAQLRVDVNDEGSNQASFKFYHVTGLTDAMSITDIYFNYTPANFLTYVSQSDSGAGVSFSASGCAPPEPPGTGNTFAVQYCTDSNPPAQPSGVNPGEWLTLKFTIAAGSDYQDLVDKLGDSSVRIAFHVQGYDGGGSETFIVNPPDGGETNVPEPTSLALLGLGMIGAGFARRRRN